MRAAFFVSFLAATVSICVIGFAGCGGGDDSSASQNSDDAQVARDTAVADVVDAGPALSYPAFPVDTPTVKNFGGPILTSTSVTALFDPLDPNKAAIMAFLNHYGTSSFWSQTTSEYGVGPIVSVDEVDLATSIPATTTAEDLVTMVASAVDAYEYADAGPTADNDAGDAGVPRTDRIFVIFTPPTTSITDNPCTISLAYHNSLHVEGNVHIPYAVVQGSCVDTKKAPTQLGVEIQALGHELVEAATDPFPFYDPAYFRVDDDHLAWGIGMGAVNQTELNDMCNAPIPTTLAGISYELANSWSNKAALAGQYPCLPSFSPVPQLMVTGVLTDEVPFNATLKTRGITLGVGESRTIDVQVSSSAPMPEPFTVTAVDVASTYFKQPPQMTLTLDKDMAQNGDVLHLTITRTALSTATSVGRGAAFVIRPQATDPSAWSPFYGFVADP